MARRVVRRFMEVSMFEIWRAAFVALHTADAGHLRDLRRFPKLFSPTPQKRSVTWAASR